MQEAVAEGLERVNASYLVGAGFLFVRLGSPLNSSFVHAASLMLSTDKPPFPLNAPP
jgi:hypothetical protein